MAYAGVSYRMQCCVLCVLWYDDCEGRPHQEAHPHDGYGLEGPAFCLWVSDGRADCGGGLPEVADLKERGRMPTRKLAANMAADWRRRRTMGMVAG